MQHKIWKGSGATLHFLFLLPFPPFFNQVSKRKRRIMTIQVVCLYFLTWVSKKWKFPYCKDTPLTCCVCSQFPQLLLGRATPQAACPHLLPQELLHPRCRTFALAFSELPDIEMSACCVEAPLNSSPALQLWALSKFCVIPQNDKGVFSLSVHVTSEGIKQYQSPRIPLVPCCHSDQLPTLWAQWSSQFYNHL